MQRLVVAMVAGIVALSSANAFALPPIPNYLADMAASKPEYKGFLEQYNNLTGKCAVCHIPGEDKKKKGHALNDFGHAFHEHLNDDAFTAAHKAKPKDAKLSPEAQKEFAAAWEKVQSDKNSDGKAFGDLIKAGELPGKNPK